MKKFRNALVQSIFLFSLGLLMAAFYLAGLIEFGDRAHQFLEAACFLFFSAWLVGAVHMFRARRTRPGADREKQEG